MEGRGEILVLSSNNYLGLSNQPEVIAAGQAALDQFGAGTASVRFICGTFTIHRELETALAELVGTPASLSFVSCWNANEAVPATLLGEEDRGQRSAEQAGDYRRGVFDGRIDRPAAGHCPDLPQARRGAHGR
jgi:hypothetical protein